MMDGEVGGGRGRGMGYGCFEDGVWVLVWF